MSLIVSDAQPLPADVQQLVNQFNALDLQLKAVNTAVRELKQRMNYSQISSTMKPVKESLFAYMQANKLKKLGEIKISTVKPSSVKTEEREEKLTARVEHCLHSELGEQGTLVAGAVVDAVLNK